MQTSFIPKKPLVEGAPVRRAHMGIMWFVALLLFVASIVAGGAAFAYQLSLQSAIKSESDSLARAQAAYDPSVINSIIRLDDRITQSKILLQKHLAPSSIFSMLESSTLQNVRFTNFSYSINPDGTAALALSGEALDFASVALQSDAFGQDRDLKDILFSDINIDPATGHIVFKMTGTVASSFLLYRNSASMAQGSAAGAAAPSPAPAASVQAPAAAAPSSSAGPSSSVPAPPIPAATSSAR